MGKGAPRLRTIPTICVALATCAATAAVAYPRAEASASSSTRLTSRESALTARVNRARASHGLAPLHVDQRLVRAARSHTEAIVSSGVFEHGRFWVWIEREGVSGGRLAETLGWSAPADGSEARIVTGWLHSPGHRAILLDRRLRDVGIGVHVGPFKGQPNAVVATADFRGPA